MAYTVTQDARELARSRKVAAVAELVTIRLTEAFVRLKVSPEEIEAPLALQLKVGSNATLVNRTLRVVVRFALAANDKKGDDILAIRCAYVATYALPDVPSVGRSEIHAFARGNALFNCWPYFRELVQNACARLGLPPLTVPLFKTRAMDPSSSPSPTAPRSANSTR